MEQWFVGICFGIIGIGIFCCITIPMLCVVKFAKAFINGYITIMENVKNNQEKEVI